MTKPDPAPDDAVVDAVLRRHLGSAASTFEPPAQPPVASLLPRRRRWHRWSAPAAVAGGLIAAATATVLIISSTAPSSGPAVGVAPSGPSAAVASTPGTSGVPSPSTDGMGREPAPRITVNGTEYALVGAVPWYSAMRIGSTVAVSTGPELRGACDRQIYRLGARRSPSGALVLTSYQYNPPEDQAPPSCGAVGLPPYVAALRLDEALPAQVLDGARSSEATLPLTRVLVPGELPAGFEAGGTDPDTPQQPDPDRPVFNAYQSPFAGADGQNLGAIGQNFHSGAQTLTITQGLQAFSTGYDTLERTTVGSYPATVNSYQGSPERCVRWTDSSAGKVEVCGTLDGGADAVVAVAQSIYADSPVSTSSSAEPPNSAAPSSVGTEPARRITVSGNEYQLIGPVPWYRAMRIGTTVAVSTGPEVRGACDSAIYRLEASRHDDGLVLTSYRYDPVQPPKFGECLGIGLPPYIATVQILSSLPRQASDGARPSSPPDVLSTVLVPSAVPAGFVARSPNGACARLCGTYQFPQVPDPERPMFPAYTADGGIVESFTSGNQGFRITQGLTSYVEGPVAQGSITVGPHPATLYGTPASDERCVRWTDTVAGKVEVCGTLDGGADTVLTVARSIYS